MRICEHEHMHKRVNTEVQCNNHTTSSTILRKHNTTTTTIYSPKTLRSVDMTTNRAGGFKGKEIVFARRRRRRRDLCARMRTEAVLSLETSFNATINRALMGCN